MDRSKIPTLFQKTSLQKDEKPPFEGDSIEMPWAKRPRDARKKPVRRQKDACAT